jgi:hypothetical protein
LQAFINMGVNMGVLPTKGLTLPLMSHGRSSLILTRARRVYHAAGKAGRTVRALQRGLASHG